MKSIRWSEFKATPRKYLGYPKIKVRMRNGSFFVATFYTPVIEQNGRAIRGEGKTKHECYICKRLQRVRFVVPFDGSFPPGYYCLKCRKENDILDVKDAKRYGKIY